MQLFLVPFSFFAFCCWRRGAPGVSIAVLEQRAPGPSLSQMCAGRGTLEVWVPLEGAVPEWRVAWRPRLGAGGLF